MHLLAVYRGHLSAPIKQLSLEEKGEGDLKEKESTKSGDLDEAGEYEEPLPASGHDSESEDMEEKENEPKEEPAIIIPESSITDPEPSVTDPEPSVTDPEPSVTDPEPSVTDPEPSDIVPVVDDHESGQSSDEEGRDEELTTIEEYVEPGAMKGNSLSKSEVTSYSSEIVEIMRSGSACGVVS